MEVFIGFIFSFPPMLKKRSNLLEICCPLPFGVSVIHTDYLLGGFFFIS